MAIGSENLMKKTLVAVVLAALALTTTGCGNKDDETAAKSISTSIMKEQKSGSTQVMQVKQGDADCIGKGLVDKIGTDQLQKYKLLDKNLKMNENLTSVKMSQKDATSATDTFFDCTDVMGMMHKAMTQGGKVPPQVQACMTKVLTKDAVHSMFVAMFSGQQDQATKSLQASLMKCASMGMQSSPN